jgi:hypothetical protein
MSTTVTAANIDFGTKLTISTRKEIVWRVADIDLELGQIVLARVYGPEAGKNLVRNPEKCWLKPEQLEMFASFA